LNVKHSIFSATETVIGAVSGIIFVLRTTIPLPQTTISALRTIVPDTKAMISERIPAIDASHTTISGPDSMIGIHEAILSVVGTFISVTEIDFSKEDTLNSTLLTGFWTAEIIMSAAQKTAGAAPLTASAVSLSSARLTGFSRA